MFDPNAAQQWLRTSTPLPAAGPTPTRISFASSAASAARSTARRRNTLVAARAIAGCTWVGGGSGSR